MENNRAKKKIGIFIDGANIYYASKKAGWKLDIEKVKKLFGSIFEVKIFNYYAALPEKTDTSYADSKKYLDVIEKFAKVITKPLKYINGQKKGNVDIEITLDVVRSLNNLDEVKPAKSNPYSLMNFHTLEKIREFVELNRKNNTPDLAAGRISVLSIIDDRNSLSRGAVNSKKHRLSTEP